MKPKKLDEECWDCLNLDGEDGLIICLAKHAVYNKNFDARCPDYEWDEVNDHPWYEKNE